MGYIGKTPTVGNFQKCDALTTSATADYTLQVSSVNVSPESVNHMIVSLNGVIQAPTTAYTVSGATLSFASALTSADVIDFVLLLGNVLDVGTPTDNTVATAKIQDDAVTLAKMAAGTDGNIISYDASGNPVAIATGNDGQVLTSAGAGNPPAFEAAAGGGAMEFIAGATFTTASNFIISSFGSGYDVHRVIVDYQRVSQSGNNSLLITISTGGSYSTSGYHWIKTGGASNSSNVTGKVGENDSEWETFADGARDTYGFTLDYHFGGLTNTGTGVYKRWWGHSHSVNTDHAHRFQANHGTGYNTDVTNAVDAIKFAVTSGTLTGSYSIYGYKKS